MGGGKGTGGGKEWEGGRGREEEDGRKMMGGGRDGEGMGEVGEAKKGRQTAHHDGEDNTDLLNNFEDAEHS